MQSEVFRKQVLDPRKASADVEESTLWEVRQTWKARAGEVLVWGCEGESGVTASSALKQSGGLNRGHHRSIAPAPPKAPQLGSGLGGPHVSTKPKPPQYSTPYPYPYGGCGPY